MEKPIIIAQIMGKMVGGGVEAVVMNYYRNIDKTKIQFDFLIDEDSTNIPREEIESMGGRIILIPPYQKLSQYIRNLTKVLKQNQYTIVHSHINTLSVFPLYAAKRAKVNSRIAHSHSTTNKKEWKKNLLKNTFKPFSKIFATDYFACSALAGRWLFSNKTFNQGKVTIINNAIDIDKFLYNETIRNNKRKELNINNKTLVIGHIGRFVKQKNHSFLIDIFNEIHKKKKDSILLLAGTGPLLDQIKTKVKELNLENNVRFLGQRTDVSELYQAMDIFLLPSLYEGLPVVGVEAQTAGLLTILSTSMTEETKVLKTTKFISLEDSATKWAEIILNDYSKFKRKNTKLEIQKNGFDISKEVKKLEEIYIELNKR